MVAAVLDAVFVTNYKDKDYQFSFIYCCSSFCGGGGALEEESHPPLHLTSPLSPYDSLHSKINGCNWALHDTHLYLVLNSE